MRLSGISDGNRDGEVAGAGDHSPLRASHADREQVIDALKVAFVDGRLARDEFDLRVGQVLAAYANLDALIADIHAPVRLTEGQPSAPAREPDNKKLIARGAAAGASVTMVLGVVLGVAAGSRGRDVRGLFPHVVELVRPDGECHVSHRPALSRHPTKIKFR
jgi:hypothetical protein